MAPPGVVAVAFGEEAEGIHKARINDCLNALAFLVRKAFYALVLLGAGEIILRMGDVQVPAENNGLFSLKPLHVLKEGGVPLLMPKGEAGEVVLSVRGIDRYHDDFAYVGRNNPAFSVGVPIVVPIEAVFLY